MPWFRATILFFCVISTALAETGVGESAFLTRSEFEAFMQQYRGDHVPQSSSTLAKKWAWKKGGFTITPYGYINLSASYETERTTTGDYAVYANSPDLEADAGFNIDPKSTRMGLMLGGPGIPGCCGSKTEGAIEFDFQGAFQSRNRAGLLLRKAYVAVTTEQKHGTTKFLAGQDWEVVSPLYPKTLNYTAGACVGNVGYRRAMLKIDRRHYLEPTSYVTTQFALADNVIRDSAAVVPGASRYPMIQGRFALTCGADRQKGPSTFGISGHVGEQRYEFVGQRKYLKTWSFNVDLDMPITKKLSLQAEYFLGENLANIEGGILQGVDIARRDTIRAQGGWVALTYQWTKKMQTNVAYMIDDPFNEDVVAGNAGNGLSRTYSHCLFVNVLYNWSDALMTGFEVDFWRTHWQRYDPATASIPAGVSAMNPGEPLRFEFVTRYTF